MEDSRGQVDRHTINTRRQWTSFDGDTNDRPSRAINRYKGDGKSVKLSRTDIPPWAFETLVSGRLAMLARLPTLMMGNDGL